MAQINVTSRATPFRELPTRGILTVVFLRRISVLFLSWGLVSCQVKERSLPSPSAPSEPVVSSQTSSPAVVDTIAAISSGTPANPSALSTSDPREFVVQSPKADIWDAPENENKYWNLETQLLLGERVLVLDRRGEWSKIAAVEQPSKKDPLGYPGWVRSEFLARGWPAAQRYAVVMAPRSQLRVEPGGSLLMSVSLDTRLPVQSTQEDWVEVHLPDGDAGWIPFRDVRLTNDLVSPIATDGLLALAEALTGVPYRWGGTTSDSLDCSGFTYRVFHAYGIILSRDADDQALGGEFVARQDLRKGDLIFVSENSGGAVSHMAMYWGKDTVLDAATNRGVTLRTFPDFFAFYYWITARRYLP